MDAVQKARAVMTAIGAAAALALYFWIKVAEGDILAERTMLLCISFTAVFFTATLAIAPRVSLGRAALFAAGLGALVSGLIWLAGLRYDTVSGLVDAGYPAISIAILCSLPLPFIIAGARGNWRDYGALFDQSWGIVLRFSMAQLLALTVWALIFLSDQLLSLVGLGFLDAIWNIQPAAYVITGAALGLGIAVSAETLALKGAGLALLLLRPLLVPITAVVALFLLALPLRGLSGLFGNLSAGMTLLAILAVAATLVTSAVDTDGAAATRSKLLALSARIMGAMMLVLGLLAAVAIGMRVGQYGWTPARVYGALACAIGLGYGALYAAASVRSDWMAAIRRANIVLALAQISLAALALTPLMNAERLSANSQMARLADGRTAAQDLDILALQSWGRAGQGAIEALTLRAAQSGQVALAERLANPSAPAANEEQRQQNARATLAKLLAVRPRSAVSQALLDDVPGHMVAQILDGCAIDLGNQQSACILLIGDFLPEIPQDEGLIVWLDSNETLSFQVLSQFERPRDWRATHFFGQDFPPTGEAAKDVLRTWHDSAPSLEPAKINQLTIGGGALILLP